ncbi:MAG: SurA N-terminal domain-containing protein, partial [Kiloniellales bacterium]|nr:SurA N-terminal domain-containing protein [Kiloniellales bacterium]
MGVRKIIARVLTILLFGVLILSFAVWGIGDIFTGQGRMQNVAEVGEIGIDQNSFAMEFTQQINNFSAQLGTRIDVEQARQFGLDRQVLRNMVSRALLDNEVRRQGLGVTDSQVRQAIAASPVFRDQFDAFDPQIFRQYLRNQGLSEQAYIDRVKTDMVARRLGSALGEAISSPREIARLIYEYENEKRIASYVRVPAIAPDEIEAPEENVLMDFYNSNQTNFQAPAYRSVALVHLDAQELAGEVAISEEKILEAFEARRESLGVPERRAIAQMIFDSEETAQAALDRLNEGLSFEEVSQEKTGQAPVDLGTSDGRGLLPELKDAAFALTSANEIAGPVKSPLGWHLLYVSEILPREDASLEDHRESLKAELAEAEAIDGIIALANALNDELGAGISLEEAATTIGLFSQTISAIDRSGRGEDGELIDDLPQGLASLAFQEEIGETSALHEDGAGGYFVIRVDSSRDPRSRPYEAVKDDVLALWQNAEAVRLAREDAERLTERLSEGESLEDIAAELEVTVETTQPLLRGESNSAALPAPRFAQQIFNLEEGGLTNMAAGDGYLIARLDKIVPADSKSDPEGLQQAKDSLKAALRADLF